MCNYCKAETRSAKLSTLENKRDFVFTQMFYGKEGENPYLFTECALGDKVMWGKVDIAFCAMCGRKLE